MHERVNAELHHLYSSNSASIFTIYAIGPHLNAVNVRELALVCNAVLGIAASKLRHGRLVVAKWLKSAVLWREFPSIMFAVVCLPVC